MTENFENICSQKKTIKNLVVIRDAELNADGAFKSIYNVFKKIGFKKPPSKPMELRESEISFEQETVKINIGIIINSDMLEDLCLEAVKGDDAFPCVDRFFDCLDVKGYKFKDKKAKKNKKGDPKDIKNPSKAKLQAFLATRSKTYPKLGVAAERGVWPFDHPAFDTIKEFLFKLNDQ